MPSDLRSTARLLLLSIALASCGGSGGDGPPSPADTRPNILFILSDDQRPDAVGAYGNASLRTPHLDRLAAEGARFDAFYVTSPSCAPSRAAFLTGRYGHQTGVMSNIATGGWAAPPELDLFGFPTADLAPETPTIAHALGAAGYVTGFVGKAHLGGDPRRWGFHETPVWLPEAAVRQRSPKLMIDGERREIEGALATEVFADAAIAFIERNRDERWFLWLAMTAPHVPYHVEPRHAYAAEDIAPPPHWPPGQSLGDADWAAYYATISLLDEQIGRVIETLRGLGLLDRTFVAFASDNGHMQSRLGGDVRISSKGVWFEDSVRVPALVRHPERVPAGTVVRTPVASIDLPAALVDLAGAGALPGASGALSLLPAAAGAMPLRSAAFAELRNPLEPWHRWEMVREGSLKYVRFDDGTELLYDLAADPYEQSPSAGGADPAALARLRGLHAEWMAATPP